MQSIFKGRSDDIKKEGSLVIMDPRGRLKNSLDQLDETVSRSVKAMRAGLSLVEIWPDLASAFETHWRLWKEMEKEGQLETQRRTLHQALQTDLNLLMEEFLECRDRIQKRSSGTNPEASVLMRFLNDLKGRIAFERDHLDDIVA